MNLPVCPLKNCSLPHMHASGEGPHGLHADQHAIANASRLLCQAIEDREGDSAIGQAVRNVREALGVKP